MVTTTTVAPTVGHGASGLTSSATPFYPAPEHDIASCVMVPCGAGYAVDPHSYVPSARQLTRVIMLPIDRINLFVGFVGGVDLGDSLGRGNPFDSHVQYFDLASATPIQSGIGPVRAPNPAAALVAGVASNSDDSGEHGHSHDADSAVPATDVVTNDENSKANDLSDDADSSAQASLDGSIAAVSTDDSICRVSNPDDFENHSVLGLLDYNTDSSEQDFGNSPKDYAVYMARDGENSDAHGEPDPMATPLPADADAATVERYRASILAATEKEHAKRDRFRLESAAINGVSFYHRDKALARAAATAAGGRALNFDNEQVTGREIVCVNATNTNPPAGATVTALHPHQATFHP